MCGGEASAMAQLIGPVGEQPHKGEVAAVGSEVPGTIDVGDALEQTDQRDGRDDAHREVCRRSADGAEGSIPGRHDCNDDREQNHRSHRPSPTHVDRVLDPPVMRADPDTAHGIEE